MRPDEEQECLEILDTNWRSPTSPISSPTITTIRKNLANFLELKRVHQEKLEKMEMSWLSFRNTTRITSSFCRD
ncbi:hypothetical protein O3P69_013619 [Scylla paramamosain]|uniref:Uncharacterized protein n=1 Tax=Scylla paramamosain TaxID=85552 RepID=A0AAW0SQP2_SCYPA